MRKIIYIFSIFSILFLTSNAQIRNVSSLNGTWNGSWINDEFLSTGDVMIMVVVDESQYLVTATFNIGGTALGQPSIDPFVEEVNYTTSGAEISLTHDIWGDISGSIDFATGEFDGTAENNPVNPSVGLMTGAGVLTSDSLKSTFTMDFAGDIITGGMNLGKENAIDAPTELNAVENNPGEVQLSWITNSENHMGFRIDRWSASSNEWMEVADIGASEVNYTDSDVEEATDYKYRIAGYNEDTESEYSNEAEITTLTNVEDEDLNLDYSLEQNYPNPFNPSTTIKFSIPMFSQVKVEVFAQTGEIVRTLFDGHLKSGEYEVNLNANDLASGIYFYRMTSNEFTSTKKMLLVK